MVSSILEAMVRAHTAGRMSAILIFSNNRSVVGSSPTGAALSTMMTKRFASKVHTFIGALADGK